MPVSLERRQELALEYGITDQDPEECVSHCEKFFKDIRGLCKIDFTDWKEKYCREDGAAWYKNTKAQASEVTHHANKLQRCSNQASESDWRRSLETIMFRHLEKDPTW